jgi:hypothetical protein
MSYEAGAIGITNSLFFPPKDFKYNIYGSQSVKKATFIEIEVDYCSQEYLERKYPKEVNMTCKPEKEANEIISEIEV